jgi:hypothetical protein
VESDLTGVDVLEDTLDGFEPNWREHLTQTE